MGGPTKESTTLVALGIKEGRGEEDGKWVQKKRAFGRGDRAKSAEGSSRIGVNG